MLMLLKVIEMARLPTLDSLKYRKMPQIISNEIDVNVFSPF